MQIKLNLQNINEKHLGVFRNKNLLEAGLSVLSELYYSFKEYKIKNKIGLPIVSIVGDTFDIYRFTREYIGTRLKERVISLGRLKLKSTYMV